MFVPSYLAASRHGVFYFVGHCERPECRRFLIDAEAIAKHEQSFGGIALVALAKLRGTHSDRSRSSLRNDL